MPPPTPRLETGSEIFSRSLESRAAFFGDPDRRSVLPVGAAMKLAPRAVSVGQGSPSSWSFGARRRFRCGVLGRRALGVFLGLALGTAIAPTARGDERWLVQGLADAEAWDTTGGSDLLERNEGRPGTAERLHVLAAWAPLARLQLFARAELEGGKGSEEGKSDARIELALARYTWGSRSRFMLQAGRIDSPVTGFARRELSSTNPLVGYPAGYEVEYPKGAELAGWCGPVDFRLALVDRPLGGGDYLPEAGSSFRPAAALGVTPAVGMRLGLSWTKGPYLGRDLAEALPAGSGWKDYRQRAYGGDLQLSRGYFEINAEFVSTLYDVPAHGVSARGRVWYLEPKYTWTPRFFTALRIESVRRPYIEPEEDEEEQGGAGKRIGWENETLRFADVEAGAGYRLGPQMVLKVSYRIDRWRVNDDLRPSFRDGRALALQLSYGFDIVSWLSRAR